MDEFVPVFEENKEENKLLVQIDEFEEKIKLIEKYSKEYEAFKKKIKAQMLKIGKESDSSQIKWTTPKGIQITCSIGKKAVYEEQEVEEFNMIKFMEEQPEMYQKYLEKKTRDVVVQSGSNDRLQITLPKENQDDND